MKKIAVVLTLALLFADAPAATAAENAGAAGGTTGITHGMMMLVMQLGIILFAAKFVSILFERVKLPGVLGELIAGVCIGPYLLGGIPLPGFPHGFFPLQGAFPVSFELYGFCSVASIVLLFVVGLETDIKLFVRYSVAGSIVGVGGVLVSFLIGDLIGVALAPMLFGEPRGFMAPSSLFLGIISTATSVGITARVLSERRKLDSPEGVTILAGAVIDDVLGIMLLAVALGAISASRASGRIDWGHIGLIAGKAFGVWLAATAAGLMASRKISVLLKGFGDRSSIATMALGLALVLAGLFEEAGLAMIVGAYVMGLSLSRTDIAHVVRERMHPIYALLVPVFFAVMGMLVDLRLLLSPRVLLFGAVYTTGAAAAKIIGCGLPTLFCGFNARGALRVGVGMLPRGEVALIVAGIGLASGFMTADVFGVVVMMTLITTLLSPPLLVRLFAGNRPGARRQPAPPRDAPQSFTFPAEQTADLVVSQILSVFEQEGFFVHALRREERLYQLRKDEIVIGFRCQGRTITFDCPHAQRPYVATAMYEVLANLEQTIRELRKPIDMGSVLRGVQDSRAPESPADAMMARYLTPQHCQPRLHGCTKTQVIDDLLDILYRTGIVRDSAAAREAVMRREESMSTGMQYGIAIPHGRTDAVTRLGCAVGLKREGVEFASADGEPARIIVLTLSPKTGAAPHVQFMATVSQILDPPGREALLACNTPEEMYTVLTAGSVPRKDSGGAAPRRA